MSRLMPKMRAIGVPVNDYFVEEFLSIPKFRYNKVPLKTVTKDKDGFHLQLDVKDQPEYFISRDKVSPPNSGGNTTNVCLGLVALYSAMQVDIQFKIILPDDKSSIAQQEINHHVYNDANIVQVHTHIWGPRECFNGNAHGRTYMLVSPPPRSTRWMQKLKHGSDGRTTFPSSRRVISTATWGRRSSCPPASASSRSSRASATTMSSSA